MVGVVDVLLVVALLEMVAALGSDDYVIVVDHLQPEQLARFEFGEVTDEVVDHHDIVNPLERFGQPILGHMLARIMIKTRHGFLGEFQRRNSTIIFYVGKSVATDTTLHKYDIKIL